MTPLLAVRDVRGARACYGDVLGGRVVMEENPCIVKLANCWVIVNLGGGPKPDKPDVRLVPYEASSRGLELMNLRVADSDGSRDRRARGAKLRTAPRDRDAGPLAEQAPAGGEAGRADGR